MQLTRLATADPQVRITFEAADFKWVPPVTNLVTDPEGLNAAAGWAWNSAGGSITAAAGSGTGPLAAVPTYMRFTYGADTTANSSWVGFSLPVTPGKQYTASAYARLSSTITGENSRMVLIFRDASGAQISAVNENGVGDLGSAYKLHSLTGAAPSNAATVVIAIQPQANIPAAATIDMSCLMLVAGNGLEADGVTPIAFFDGNVQPASPDLVSAWDGDAAASTSTRTAKVATVAVLRTADGVDTTVRSSKYAPAAGGWTGIDSEAPLGEVSYRAHQWDAAGNPIGDTASQTITVPVTDRNVAWLSDPFDAGSAVRVMMLSGAGQGQSRPASGTKLLLGDRAIVLVGGRALLTDLSASFYTDTPADRDAVTALISRTGGLTLLRTAPPFPLPRMLYMWAPDPQPTFYNTDRMFGSATWENTVDELSEFEGGVAVAAVTYQQYEDQFPTYTDAETAYPTYLEAMKNSPGSQ